MTQPENPNGTAAETGRRPSRTDPGAGKLRTVIGKIGWELDHPESWMIPPGDVASLRRARPGEIGGPAFWKIAVRHLEPAGLLPAESAPWRDEAERRWTAILGGMALMAGLHAGGVRPGRAFAERSVAEHRVMRLLQARGDALLTLVRTVAHQLASLGARVDWTDLAELVRWDGTEWQDPVRRRIALDYYSNLKR